jgi:hypothetical protein
MCKDIEKIPFNLKTQHFKTRFHKTNNIRKNIHTRKHSWVGEMSVKNGPYSHPDQEFYIIMSIVSIPQKQVGEMK